jgi:hypothetical protein
MALKEHKRIDTAALRRAMGDRKQAKINRKAVQEAKKPKTVAECADQIEMIKAMI